jgi:hypothetical protein
MVQPLKYSETRQPLEHIVDFLEKANEDALAAKVIEVFARHSFNIEQFNLIAKLFLDVRDIPLAEKYALKVLEMTDDLNQKFAARANLAKMYNNINMPEKSLFYTNINRAIMPKDPDTLLESVFSLYLLGRKPEAEIILRDMETYKDQLSERHRDIVNFNLGTYNMEKGKFLEGLGGFLLNVKKLEIWFSPKELPYKFWDGGAYPGKTLIMFMEGGGIGDEMLTVRFYDNLKAMGFDPVYYTGRKDLYEIFNRCGYKTIMTLDGIPEDAMWTYAMQTPLWLQCKPEEVIRSNYLYPSNEARDKWAFIKEDKKLRIGVRWQGNAKNERDLHRKVPIADMMKTLHEVYDGQDVSFYSLQLGDGVEEMSNYPELIDISDRISSYNDTLALMENLDLVVTSCTSVLHAAAIVGTPTMGMIPISAYFTWVSPPTPGRPDNSSIWYEDNLRLFRQIVPNNWDKPFNELKTFLIEHWPSAK